MFLLLLLPILVSGFLVCHWHPLYYFRLHRYEGQYLYLQSARLGLFCSLMALVLHLALFLVVSNRSWPVGAYTLSLNYFTALARLIQRTGTIEAASQATQMAWILILTITALLIPRCWAVLAKVNLKLRYGLKEENYATFIMAGLLKDSPLDDLLLNATINKETLMLSLDERKVYVGRITTLGEPSETEGADQEVCIKPIMSGYRDKDKLWVTFTTHYAEADKDIYLTIKQSQIVSATKFDFDAYERFVRSKKVEPTV
ncbi:hypothetical protein IQ22_02882 [Pseudomonas duriflava]|uniref:Uncharacterized protein n=1 Tax=Pseudomonas duriflava TaxID=459528 RepID=A0A562Q8I0_9PSED|nr:hypothetical protein [Pseudomonas duriflava]TWI53043.1 hypothetical protein IQ22_02882 [Pseudomonas duriflava]